ncbi:MAG: hypothetical protein ACRBBN_08905 [Methyloligellaceae bacterium]
MLNSAFKPAFSFALQAKLQKISAIKTIFCEWKTFPHTESASGAMSSMGMTTATIAMKAMNFLNKSLANFRCLAQVDISKACSLCGLNQIDK